MKIYVYIAYIIYIYMYISYTFIMQILCMRVIPYSYVCAHNYWYLHRIYTLTHLPKKNWTGLPGRLYPAVRNASRKSIKTHYDRRLVRLMDKILQRWLKRTLYLNVFSKDIDGISSINQLVWELVINYIYIMYIHIII